MNPHVKEDWFFHYLGEKYYRVDEWYDTGIWVKVGGLGLVICTIEVNLWNHCNLGFRIIDDANVPLLPHREKINNRHPSHFTFETSHVSPESQSPVTFHVIANCQYAKLQIRPSDTHPSNQNKGVAQINASMNASFSLPDAVWNHKPISTMTVIPLVPHYQGGANTIFTYPQSRTPRTVDDDKPPVTYPDKINPSSSSGVPPQ